MPFFINVKNKINKDIFISSFLSDTTSPCGLLINKEKLSSFSATAPPIISTAMTVLISPALIVATPDVTI